MLARVRAVFLGGGGKLEITSVYPDPGYKNACIGNGHSVAIVRHAHVHKD